jgi:hypothetical protein
MTRDALRRLVDELCDIYSNHVSSRDQIHPGFAPPCTLMTLETGINGITRQWGEMSVQLEGTEDNLRFVTADNTVMLEQ